MKTFITILILFVAAGCGNSFTEEDVVGSYEAKIDGNILKYVLFEHGKIEVYQNGEKKEDAKWEMVGKEIHTERTLGKIGILKIEANGDLTIIARIRNGKREEGPKEVRTTFKKVK